MHNGGLSVASKSLGLILLLIVVVLAVVYIRFMEPMTVVTTITWENGSWASNPYSLEEFKGLVCINCGNRSTLGIRVVEFRLPPKSEDSVFKFVNDNLIRTFEGRRYNYTDFALYTLSFYTREDNVSEGSYAFKGVGCVDSGKRYCDNYFVIFNFELGLDGNISFSKMRYGKYGSTQKGDGLSFEGILQEYRDLATSLAVKDEEMMGITPNLSRIHWLPDRPGIIELNYVSDVPGLVGESFGRFKGFSVPETKVWVNVSQGVVVLLNKTAWTPFSVNKTLWYRSFNYSQYGDGKCINESIAIDLSKTKANPAYVQLRPPLEVNKDDAGNYIIYWGSPNIECHSDKRYSIGIKVSCDGRGVDIIKDYVFCPFG